jgi:hypothetical protein
MQWHFAITACYGNSAAKVAYSVLRGLLLFSFWLRIAVQHMLSGSSRSNTRTAPFLLQAKNCSALVAFDCVTVNTFYLEKQEVVFASTDWDCVPLQANGNDGK